MADDFDPYREALVVETSTVWPEELANLAPDEQSRITVTAEDVERADKT